MSKALEIAIENRSVDKLSQLDCLCLKFGSDGWPDRCVIYAPGRVIWMEFKAQDGRIRPAQKVRKKQLEAKGHVVIFPALSKKQSGPLLRLEDLSENQNRAIDVMVQRQRTNLWAKPGTGKTVVGATALLYSYEFPTLLCATKRICELVWRQELERWEHLREIDIELMFGTGEKRERILNQPHDIYLLNYELLPWLVDTLHGDPWPFKSVLFDEISKMKWPGTRRFKKMRSKVDLMNTRFGLTGSPRGNSMLGLWGQTFMTNGPVLAPTMTAYKAAWFRPVDDKFRVWRPNPGAEREIREAAQPFAFSMPRSAASKEATVRTVPIQLPREARKLYDQIEKDLELEIEDYHIPAVEPAVARGKKLQLCSGAIYAPDKTVLHIHDAKLDALEEIIDELQDEPLLIFYRYRHELERIQKRFSGVLGIKDAQKWLDHGGLLAVHPQSAAHGLNLHVGGASTMAWYTLPDSQEMWEQGNRRLARTGQKNEVIALLLSCVNTLEFDIAKELEKHGRLQDQLIDIADEEIDNG